MTVLTHTPDPLKTVYVAARTCYSALAPEVLWEKAVEPSKMLELVEKIVGSGHLSVLEHVNFTFGITGVSRVTTHQLVRHRLASYSQQSQRYVTEKGDFDYVIPPAIAQHPQLKSRFEGLMKRLSEEYHYLLEQGIEGEDARYIFPNSTLSNIAVTMNARQLLHFFELRTCSRAQWEIRELSWRMLREAYEIAPWIFAKAGPTCLSGLCSEGAHTCGVSVKEENRDKIFELLDSQKFVSSNPPVMSANDSAAVDFERALAPLSVPGSNGNGQ
ncbi:MAG: FAD-dependent thymidylate synthase [bacterium]